MPDSPHRVTEWVLKINLLKTKGRKTTIVTIIEL